MIIQNFRKTVFYKGIGRFSGETFMGEFTFKVSLNPLEVIATDRYYRELLGGNPLSATNSAQEMAFALSQLKYRIDKAPSWWEDVFNPNSNFFDYAIIVEVLNLSYEAEQEFKAKTEENLNKAKERIEKVLKNKKSEEETVQDE